MNNAQAETIREIRTHHADLNQQIAELQCWCDEVDELGTAKFGELGERLAAFRDMMLEHFQDEEQSEFMKRLAATEQIQNVRQEHSELVSELTRLSDKLERPDPPFHYWNEVCQEFQGFLDRIVQHEEMEMVIYQQVQK